ncbi:MAG: hypothetical protein J5947_08810 [Clostridium sp.]|nr:hypothetical protein [Clostridium sp.]
MYLDAWIEDLDKATDALVRCFNSMANKMVAVKNPDMVGIITGEITAWFTEYGKYITPLPDAAVNLTEASVRALVEEAIKDFNFVDNTEELKAEQIKSLALTHIGIPGLDEKIQEYVDRMNDPSEQLEPRDACIGLSGHRTATTWALTASGTAARHMRKDNLISMVNGD